MAFVIGRGRSRSRNRTATTIIVAIHGGVLIVEVEVVYCMLGYRIVRKKLCRVLSTSEIFVVPQLRVEDFRGI